MTALRLAVPELDADVEAALDGDGTRAVLALAHGAGAGIHHAFMQALTEALVARDVTVLRYAFPYMSAGRRRPDRAPVLEATVRAAVAHALARAEGRPVFAGGKSMGGRMTARADAERPLEGVRGLVFVGFPLHPAGKPGVERAASLASVGRPMLFLQGTRDALADLDLLRPVVAALPAARLHVVEGADHGFHVLKRSGRTDAEVMTELAETTVAWMDGA